MTFENAALVLVDDQVGLMTGVRDYSTGELKHNVLATVKAESTSGKIQKIRLSRDISKIERTRSGNCCAFTSRF